MAEFDCAPDDDDVMANGMTALLPNAPMAKKRRQGFYTACFNVCRTVFPPRIVDGLSLSLSWFSQIREFLLCVRHSGWSSAPDDDDVADGDFSEDHMLWTRV